MRRVIAVAATLALAGCFGPSEEEKTQALVQAAIRARLKDPASAQFGAITVVAPNRACQTVNARNGFGGYTGDKQAFVMKLDGNWHALKIEEVSHSNCVAIMKEIKEKD